MSPIISSKSTNSYSGAHYVLKGGVFSMIIVFLAAISLLSLAAINYLAHPPIADQVFSISAEGKTTVSPDIAEIQFALVNQGKDIKLLQQESNQKVNDAIAFLKSKNISAQDIKTTGYNLSPQYVYPDRDYPNGASPSGYNRKPPTISGYELRQSINVKIRNFDIIGDVLNGLTSRGINQISGPNFSVDDPDKFTAQARKQAITKAQAKAAEIVRQSGIHLGRIINVSEGGDRGVFPIFAARSADMGMGGTLPLATPAPVIEPGSQDLTVNITLVYEVK